MTGHPDNNDAMTSTPDKTSLLAPLRPQRNRTAEVSERIATLITGGKLQPGERLPTEAELMEAMGVSRTVVREAVAALKADGLVVTRQGAGAFVASDAARMPFRIDPDSLSSIDDVIAVMELRLAVEVEAAALAAERAPAAAVKAIGVALAAIDRAIAAGESAVAEDFAFHQAIAKATANAHFPSFLNFLGVHVIPRQRVRSSMSSGEERTRYLKRVQSEHEEITAAIRAGDSSRARKAMRLHLENSLQRYRRLAERAHGAPGLSQPKTKGGDGNA